VVGAGDTGDQPTEGSYLYCGQFCNSDVIIAGGSGTKSVQAINRHSGQVGATLYSSVTTFTVTRARALVTIVSATLYSRATTVSVTRAGALVTVVSATLYISVTRGRGSCHNSQCYLYSRVTTFTVSRAGSGGSRVLEWGAYLQVHFPSQPLLDDLSNFEFKKLHWLSLICRSFKSM